MVPRAEGKAGSTLVLGETLRSRAQLWESDSLDLKLVPPPALVKFFIEECNEKQREKGKGVPMYPTFRV